MFDIVKGHSFGLMRGVVDMDMIALNCYKRRRDIGDYQANVRQIRAG